jgi:hypothetical protein
MERPEQAMVERVINHEMRGSPGPPRNAGPGLLQPLLLGGQQGRVGQGRR